MRRTILSLLTTLALMVLFLVPTPVAAQTTDVTVNATPAYISISVAPATYNFGVIAAGSTTTTLADDFIVTNSSTVATNVTIGVTGATWTGGVAWTHDDTATPGADTVGMNSTTADGAWGTNEVIVKNAAPDKIATGLAATTNFDFGLKLLAPTSFSDGVVKGNTVRLTAST